MEKEFKEIVTVLKEAKRLKYIRDFALTGALALTHPRATRDIDMLLSLKQDAIKDFIIWLKIAKDYRFTKHHKGRAKDRIKDLIEVRTGSTWADLIVAGSDIEHEAIQTAPSIKVFKNLRLKVIRPEYLIILKLLAGSEQDYIDSANLWNDPIDRKLVKRITKGLFMETKLDKLIDKAKKITKG